MPIPPVSADKIVEAMDRFDSDFVATHNGQIRKAIKHIVMQSKMKTSCIQLNN